MWQLLQQLPKKSWEPAIPYPNVMTKVAFPVEIVRQDSGCAAPSRKLAKNLQIIYRLTFFFYRVTTCDSTVFNNCTYIENPLYPTKQAASSTCAYKIRPISSDICQLRLDLDNFDLTGKLQVLYSLHDTAITISILFIPETTAGVCTDKFTMTSGSGRVYQSLCGTLTDQHCKILTMLL